MASSSLGSGQSDHGSGAKQGEQGSGGPQGQETRVMVRFVRNLSSGEPGFDWFRHTTQDRQMLGDGSCSRLVTETVRGAGDR